MYKALVIAEEHRDVIGIAHLGMKMAMMASGSGNPYDNLNNTQIEQDLIDPDDGRCSIGLSS